METNTVELSKDACWVPADVDAYHKAVKSPMDSAKVKVPGMDASILAKFGQTTAKSAYDEPALSTGGEVALPQSMSKLVTTTAVGPNGVGKMMSRGKSGKHSMECYCCCASSAVRDIHCFVVTEQSWAPGDQTGALAHTEAGVIDLALAVQYVTIEVKGKGHDITTADIVGCQVTDEESTCQVEDTKCVAAFDESSPAADVTMGQDVANMVKTPNDRSDPIGVASMKSDGDSCGGVVSLTWQAADKLTKPTGMSEKTDGSDAPYFLCTVDCTSGTGDAALSAEWVQQQHDEVEVKKPEWKTTKDKPDPSDPHVQTQQAKKTGNTKEPVLTTFGTGKVSKDADTDDNVPKSTEVTTTSTIFHECEYFDRSNTSCKNCTVKGLGNSTEVPNWPSKQPDQMRKTTKTALIGGVKNTTCVTNNCVCKGRG